ncbi:MAG: dihydroorotate dehydrogenase electron transfer subunit [Sedimentisphaerales bacterium]|nr:dihydroorotate dehydrogenase electron transfer subunit [Sedimentisphaerales bacterium]
MSEKKTLSDKGLFCATVRANKQIGLRFYRLGLEFTGDGAKAFANFRPGQFAEFDLSGTALPPKERIPEDLVDVCQRNILLRRPFAFVDVNADKNKTFAEVLYRVVGPASLRMTTLAAGNSVSIIGPLGNGFRVPEGKKRALLICGGMGAPPLQHLAKVFTADYPDIEVVVFAGAKTANDLPFEGRLDNISQQLGFSLMEFAKYGVKSQVATDDGSAGFEGMVTDCFKQWLDKSNPPRERAIIYACGPEPMLAKVAEIAKEKNMDCQISMERRMACGIGICQSCAVKCRVEGAQETVYKLCCEDGPVFDSKEVVFLR